MNIYKTVQTLNETIQKLCAVKVEGKTNWKLMTESVETLEQIMNDMIAMINQQTSSEENKDDNTGV